MLRMNGRKSPGLGTHMERNQWRWESSSLEEEDRVFSKWSLYFNCVCDILGVYSRGIVNSLVTQSGRITSEVEP